MVNKVVELVARFICFYQQQLYDKPLRSFAITGGLT